MADRVDYNVNAWLRARGDFARQMQRNAAAVLPLQRRLDAAGRFTQQWGRTVMGTTAATAAGYAKVGVAIGGIGLASGFGAALKIGSDFNAQMESTSMSIASMFQLYNQNQGVFQKNLGQAKGAMRDLFDMTKRSPVEFQEGVNIYQGAAAGMIVANQSMQEQMEFMKGAQMLAGVVPDLDSKVIGGQLGRIIMGGAGAEFEVWKRMAPAVLEAGKATGVFSKNMRLGQKFTQEFNQLAQSSPEMAMELLKTAVKPLEDLADEYERSWGGILSTTRSNLRLLAGSFAGPLHEARKRLLLEMNRTGFMSDENLRKLEHIAAVMGVLLANGAENLFRKLVEGAEFVQDNWQRILEVGKHAAVLAAAAIKGAFFIGVARMIAGAAMIGAGGMMRGAGRARGALQAAGGFFGRQQRMAHAAIVRGGHGKRGGILGGMGRMLGARSGGANDPFRNIARLLAKWSSFGVVLAAGIPLVVGLVAVFGSLFTIVAGLSAYVIQNWDAISSSIIQGLESGRITLVPFLSALYTVWNQLLIVGQAFLGSGDHASQFSNLLSVFTSIVQVAGSAIGFFMKAIAISIGIWGALKLAFQGVMKTVLELMELMHGVGMVSDDEIGHARKQYDKYARGVQDTFTTVDRLLTKADEIQNFKLDKLDMAKVEKEAKQWEDKLSKALKGDEPGKKKKPRGPQVRVNTVNIIQDLRDTDPDRLMAAFVRPLEQMADQRVQAYDQLDQGI